MSDTIAQLRSLFSDSRDFSEDSIEKMYFLYKKLGDEVGMGEYTQRISDSNKKDKIYHEAIINDNLQYKPYTAPKRKYSIQELLDFETQIENAKDGVALYISHPYYRSLLRKKATLLGLETYSYVDMDKEMDNDNELIYHYRCRMSSPSDLFFWHSDWGTFGGYMGSYANCPNCHRRIYSDFVKGSSDFDQDCSLSYKLVQGKNTLFIGTEEQVAEHKLYLKRKSEQWNRKQVRKKKEKQLPSKSND